MVIDDQEGTLDKLSRPALQATITVDGGPLQLMACHFKSKLLEFPHGFAPDNEDQRARYGTYALGRRAAEAATTRITANQLSTWCTRSSGDRESKRLAVATEGRYSVTDVAARLSRCEIHSVGSDARTPISLS
ncbi:hypothetical protein GCM10023201_15020 [Actinomycetospora corticicola]|uniref:Uncharacterized protein n=1 Tax=Actinomycetospora corticicola TaxID=663602 RepID=A0A7Y9DV92_9PSEU|nr:hypothetical protein [Actinomycetospora corticicola]NYD36140.1 hypothetical protein [Actinomycetospora corticicola]